MKNALLILTLFFALSMTSCKKNTSDTSSDTQELLFGQVLENTATNVITATYKDLYDESVVMNNLATILTIGDEAALTQVKNAWIATRSPWEKSEGFLYGPVDLEGIDPAIDSWPVDVTSINSILSSGNAITASLLESNNEARGFHTIEYLIWGIDGTKAASQLTTRELEYLRAATANMKDKTQQLYYGWLTTQGNFANNFINAGTSSSVYASKKAALEEITEGISIIADEVANGKIEEPLNGNAGAAKPEAEESRFSNNSKQDFADNIRSIQNIYLGDYDGILGAGLTDIVSSKNATLDANLKAKITEAVTAIENIPGTFTQAISSHRTEVQYAQTKVSELHNMIETQLLPLISNL